MKLAHILVTVAIAVTAYALLLALVPNLDSTMPGWQRVLIAIAAVTAFVAALRAMTLVFGPVKQ